MGHAMRFLLYNIRYGTGGKPRRLPFGGYLARTHNRLPLLIDFMRRLDPDVIGPNDLFGGTYADQIIASLTSNVLSPLE